MYQKIIIVGHLGRDPEMRYTQDGTPVTSFRVATNRRWTDREGGQREQDEGGEAEHARAMRAVPLPEAGGGVAPPLPGEGTGRHRPTRGSSSG